MGCAKIIDSVIKKIHQQIITSKVGGKYTDTVHVVFCNSYRISIVHCTSKTTKMTCRCTEVTNEAKHLSKSPIKCIALAYRNVKGWMVTIMDAMYRNRTSITFPEKPKKYFFLD